MVPHDVRLMVGGESFDRCWTSFEVQQDIRRWPMDWRFTVQPVAMDTARRLLENVRNAAMVEVAVAGTTVARGRIVDIETGIERDKGTFATVSGSGPLGPASKAAMPLGHSVRGMTVKDAVESALEPWGVEVVGSNETNRAATTMRAQRYRVDTSGNELHFVRGTADYIDPVAAAAGEWRTRQVPDDRAVVARPGETVAGWLQRFLREMNLLAWETARGQVFVGLPRYDTPPIFTIVVPETPVSSEPVEEQVVSSKLVERPGDQATEVTVTGRVGRGGTTATSATETDDILVDTGWHSPRLITDDKLRDQSKAAARARQALAAEQLESYVYEVTIAGHGVGRFLPAIDTMINVRDAVCRVNETLWCAARSFTYNRDRGAEVKLTLVRPNLWLPEAE